MNRARSQPAEAKKEEPKKAAEPAKKEEPKKAAEPAKKEEPKKADAAAGGIVPLWFASDVCVSAVTAAPAAGGDASQATLGTCITIYDYQSGGRPYDFPFKAGERIAGGQPFDNRVAHSSFLVRPLRSRRIRRRHGLVARCASRRRVRLLPGQLRANGEHLVTSFVCILRGGFVEPRKLRVCRAIRCW